MADSAESSATVSPLARPAVAGAAPFHADDAVDDREQRRQRQRNVQQQIGEAASVQPHGVVPLGLARADDGAEKIFDRQRQLHLTVRFHFGQADDGVGLERVGRKFQPFVDASWRRRTERGTSQLLHRHAEARSHLADARRLRHQREGFDARTVADHRPAAQIEQGAADRIDDRWVRGHAFLRRAGGEHVGFDQHAAAARESAQRQTFPHDRVEPGGRVVFTVKKRDGRHGMTLLRKNPPAGAEKAGRVQLLAPERLRGVTPLGMGT